MIKKQKGIFYMYQEKILSNGIRFYGEYIPQVRTASVGIWVKAGSSTESDAENGLSHFLEHLFFKGTEKRSYKQIAEEFDNLGIQSNAYTSKEMTCYYVKAIDSKLSEAVDILTDMFCHSVFPQREVEKERGVILEEIAMSLDTPDDLLMDCLSEKFFSGTELSRTILGPAENIRKFTREQILDYRNKHYYGKNIVIAAVGNYNEEKLLAELEEKMQGVPSGEKVNVYHLCTNWKPVKKEFCIHKDIEQAHLGIAFPGPGSAEEDRYAFSILANIFGGGMSSRLFQKVREELGAAYSVYAYPAIYYQAGALIIYAGISPEKTQVVEEAILNEIKIVREKGISQEELEHTKTQISASYIMGQESTSAKMNLLGRNALLLEKIISEEEMLENIQKVTMTDMNNIIERVLQEKMRCTGWVLPQEQ